MSNSNKQMAGVQIKLILEKGVLEDNFPLGGGHLRLKLQFILSDEERDRIRSLVLISFPCYVCNAVMLMIFLQHLRLNASTQLLPWYLAIGIEIKLKCTQLEYSHRLIHTHSN